jgi:pyruvate dehydrogenase E2 component (dihydrolipoamide acetyltransferase)
MAYEIVVPRLGLTMEEGRIVEWFKQSGETTEAGEPLFAVETDKVVLEVEAPISGIVYPLPDLPSESMPIGTLIGYILAPGEQPPQQEAVPSVTPAAAEAETPVPHASATVGTGPADGQRKLASPAARRRATELGMDWRAIERPGGGPILVAHIETAAQAREQASHIEASPVARKLAQAAGIDLAELAARKPGEKIQRAHVEAAIAAREETQAEAIIPATPAPVMGTMMPITQIRRVIAQRMAEGSQTTAPVTLTTEADATDLVAVREQFKAALGSRNMVVPTYTDLLVKLTSIALSEHPMLNATWQEDGILIPDGIHIAVAVDVEEGLIVPVIRDVPSKSIQQIAEESRALVQGARNRQLGVDDLQGGTFTITNLGTYGIDAFTPIINLPQCAIMGIGRIIEKPAVVDGQLVPRKMMALSLTFDHRVVDGGPAARFLSTIREYVEQPYSWLTR